MPITQNNIKTEMMPESLTIATSQFPVGMDVASNLRYIMEKIHAAAERNTDIIHFYESSLSGYPGTDHPGINTEDEGPHRRSPGRTREEAGRQGI